MRSKTGVLLLSARNVTNGRLLLEDVDYVPNEEFERIAKRILPQKGDVLISCSGSIGRVCAVPSGLKFAMVRSVALVRPDETKLDTSFLYHQLTSERIQEQMRLAASQAAQANLFQGHITQLIVVVPPLPEQRKIADILTTWDEALTQLDALIEAQERRKKALMQQLLTGKKRFPGFKGKWKTVSLGDVLEPITRPTAKPQGKFLAAGIRSHGKGVFLKHDFIPANIALDELFELKTGDLVVNITFAWEGAAAIVPPEADGALVSHRFPAFGFREGKAARSFFRHYIRTHRFVFDCGLASPGGAGRNRVLSKSAFLDIELQLPPIEEQQKIGDILDTADQQLTLLRTQRTALDQQKRGLMQRLLTGKLRVKTTQTTT
jgi:type I restriction enzyme S subunit